MTGLTLGAFVNPIKDMDRAVAFYTDTLGLVLQQKDEHLSILDAGTAQFWLLDYQGRLEPRGGPTQVIFFVADGIEAYERRVRDAGCSFREELHEDRLGRLFIFLDSEGNSVEIRQPASVLTSG